MSVNGSPYAVNEPITNDIRTINFFNGRLLAAEDLRREQDANLRLRDRLGLAVGDGVVTGLEVRVPAGGAAGQPVVAVSAGVAVNRRGRALELPADTVVTLVHRQNGQEPQPGGDFAPCSGLGPGTPITVSGVYLMTVAPAAAPVGRAPVSGLGNESASCNTDACADGVRFRAIHLNLDAELLADVARLRNRLAHLMFGSTDPRRFRLERDPFGAAAEPYGLLDDLRATGLSPDEVPLACLFWTPGVGLRFVDMWSVRRQVTRPVASTDWSDAVGNRRRFEAEAAFLQFQDEVADLRIQVAPETAVATDHFRHLPAAGLLPLASGGRRGYDYRTFFGALPVRGPTFIEGAQLADLLRQSFAFPPIELARQEAMWLYQVRENQQPPGLQTSLVFTSGHLPYRADARYDLTHWNYANYARVG